MSTKVVGTGAPRTLTVRFKPCEVAIVRDQLNRRRRAETEPAELLLVARALEDLDMPVVAGRPREVIAPTGFLGDVIRSAALEAADRLGEAVAAFAGSESRTPDELRAAVDTAAALAATLIVLDHVQHG